MLYLFWQIVAPFAVVLATAGIAATLLIPIDKWFRKLTQSPRLSAFVMVIGFFIIIVLPLFLLGTLMVQEASDIINSSLAENGWVQSVDLSNNQLMRVLPPPVRQQLLSADVVSIGRSLARWVFEHISDLLSNAVTVIFHIFIFFIALYYLLVDREHIYQLMLDLSPFKDKLDEDILARIAHTVRSVVFGALIIAFVQAILATMGMAIFGVPGALLWGSIVIIAAQVPTLGVGLVMVPAIAYLIITGAMGAAIGLTIWSIFVVGLVDNFLSPKIIGSQTKMNELMILISILGGLQLFGPVGFILGPTILAAVMVIVELYKGGMLEKSSYSSKRHIGDNKKPS